MIDYVRYSLGVLVLSIYAPGLLFWLVIHPWVHWWRTIGPLRTFFILFSTLTVLGVLLYRVRKPLLGRDLGTNWILVGSGLLFEGILAWLGLTYGRHMAHLRLGTRMGIPELLRHDGRQTLMREGIYRVVRHPVYVTAAVAGISVALVINYLGVYILFVSALPVLYLITILEERELVARFGEEYRQYQREVPRLIPRWETMRRGLRPSC